MLNINECIPKNVILDTGAVTLLFSKEFTMAIGIDVTRLTLGQPFLIAKGALEKSMGVTKKVVFTLSRGTLQERRCHLKVVDIAT